MDKLIKGLSAEAGEAFSKGAREAGLSQAAYLEALVHGQDGPVAVSVVHTDPDDAPIRGWTHGQTDAILAAAKMAGYDSLADFIEYLGESIELIRLENANPSRRENELEAECDRLKQEVARLEAGFPREATFALVPIGEGVTPAVGKVVDRLPEFRHGQRTEGFIHKVTRKKGRAGSRVSQVTVEAVEMPEVVEGEFREEML